MHNASEVDGVKRVILGYRVIDGKTGKQVGKDYKPEQRARARARQDKLDLEYGSYRYSVQPVWGIDLGL